MAERGGGAALSPSKVELVKQGSNFLRDNLLEELQRPEEPFSETAVQVLKHHGMYQQRDRDNPDKEDNFFLMVRVKLPGGTLTAEQFLALIELADKFAAGTLRVTTRQDVQIHYVRKAGIRDVIRRINDVGLTTLGACGDVVRNVICCPAAVWKDSVREQNRQLARAITSHFLPRSNAYREIWRDGVCGVPGPDEEPIYGSAYLPRKFKIAIALPEDNCTDALTNDVALVAVVEDGQLKGYDIYVGGGLGTSPVGTKTFPALAQPFCFGTPEEVIPVLEAIVKVFRDHGNRSQRNQARLKYLLRQWGMQRFRQTVEEYLDRSLPDPLGVQPQGLEHHLGWHRQTADKWFLGVYVENGRIADSSEIRVKTALRTLCERFGLGIALTPLQTLLLTDIADGHRQEVEQILRDHGLLPAEQVSQLRKHSMACVGLPTCPLAITESERIAPQLFDKLEKELATLGLEQLPLCVRVTGCSNGCGRPYVAEIGITGRSPLKYRIYLGGNQLGTRLGQVFEDSVPLEQIPERLRAVLSVFAAERNNGESFGDFCARVGIERLKEKAQL